MKDWSQYGEQKAILDHFAGRVGRFLDIGAFDGASNSNTRALAELGWSGVCVEPSPPAFCALMREYAENPKIELMNTAITHTATGLFSFHCNSPDGHAADMMSTFLSEQRIRVVKLGYPMMRKVFSVAISWKVLLETCKWVNGSPFDFVNIDVEGMNADVLQAMPFSPEVICVEWDKERDGQIPAQILTAGGYRITEIGGNLLGFKGATQ